MALLCSFPLRLLCRRRRRRLRRRPRRRRPLQAIKLEAPTFVCVLAPESWLAGDGWARASGPAERGHTPQQR